MSTHTTEEAGTIPVVSSFHLDVTPGDIMDKRNTTLGNFSSNIRHVLFSTHQSNSEALEERIRQENKIQNTFFTKTFNTTGREQVLRYPIIFANPTYLYCLPQIIDKKF